MTPNNIVNMAMLSGLNAIALTDHNTCGNCAATETVAHEAGLLFLSGMELCTAEEAHVVCLFPSSKAALDFEAIVTPTLPPVRNRPEIFGEQVLMNEKDEQVGTIDTLLTIASGISVDDVVRLARSLGGTAFPAHIDRPSYSVTAALGDVPSVGFAAIEMTADADTDALCARYLEATGKPLLLNSDAHYLEHIREAGAYLELPIPTPQSIIAALNGEFDVEWSRG